MSAINSVCVAGAGAIGSLFAGHLGSLVDTRVLVRRQEHADRLNSEGLKISGKSDLQSTVRASTDPAEIDDVDLLIIATKAMAVEPVARSIAGHFTGATVMTVQNGLGCEDVVAGQGEWPMISSITFMSGVKHSDVHTEYELDTETWLGPWSKRGTSMEFANATADLINRSGLRAKAFEDVRPAQWSKLIFNSCVNSIGAVTDLPHVKDFARCDEVTDLGNLVVNMMNEGKALAAAQGIDLYEDPWEMNCNAVNRGNTGEADYAHVFSMLDDVRARRLTEVDWLTGAIVREGKRLGIATPIHEVMYGLVKGIEHAWKHEREGSNT